MKNCKKFEKLLVGYLHGELYESEYHALRAHLETCASCRSELEAQRATLELLGEALAAAPAPARLSARRSVPERTVDLRQNLFARIWFSPQLKATLATGVLASFFFLFSGLFVVFKAMPKMEAEFRPPPPVERPKANLKKPKVKATSSSAPKPSSRVVAKVKTAPRPEIELPDLMGSGEGLLGGIDSQEKDRMAKAWALDVDENTPAYRYEQLADGAASTSSERGVLDGEQVASEGRSRQLGIFFGFETGGVVDNSSGNREQSARPEQENVALVADLFGEVQTEEDAYIADTPVVGREPAPVSEPAAPAVAQSESTFNRDFRGEDKKDSSDLGLAGADTKQAGTMLFGDVAAQAAPPTSGTSGEKGAETSTEDEIVTQLRFGSSIASDAGAAVPCSSPLSQTKQEAAKKPSEENDAISSNEPDTSPRPRRPAAFNPYVMAADNAFSTFSIDVDTASYGLARQQLYSGALPEAETVRTEEFINSFDYDYRPPTGTQTFAVHSALAPSPFRTRMDLLKIGVKGRRIGRDDHRGAVLTLVIDTSGSMSTPERLGLVKQSLALLLDELNPDDEVAIVQFGGEARVVLEHTPIAEKDALLNAIKLVQAGGPTQFDKGLELGYQLAVDGFRAGDSNRIIVLSDGVANLGELDPDAMLKQVAEQRKKGIYLSVLGFGAGTYDDELLERLANRGDGMYAYVDTLDEARHLFVDQLAATLHVIASDVKIQVEFNPNRVLRYRQLGYENRQLTKEQFRDDTVDAGEVGSGQSVTALYDVELKPDGSPSEPIATVYVRYRRADTSAVEEISSRVMDDERVERFEDTDPHFQLAACTAEFAERLRRSPYTQGTEMTDIRARLQPVAMSMELDEQVQELVRLLAIAQRLED